MNTETEHSRPAHHSGSMNMLIPDRERLARMKTVGKRLPGEISDAVRGSVLRDGIVSIRVYDGVGTRRVFFRHDLTGRWRFGHVELYDKTSPHLKHLQWEAMDRRGLSLLCQWDNDPEGQRQ